MAKIHQYKLLLNWTGNTGLGTAEYKAYERDFSIAISGKPDILGSSDPAFRGNPNKYNPEELLLASISSCHMLWYLHLCSASSIIVLAYTDNPIGKMQEDENGSGKFSEVILYPQVTVQKESMLAKANELHKKANEMCFIANSLNFQVSHSPSTLFID